MSEPPTAALFPGQGSQRHETRSIVERHQPDLLELAIEQVGSDPFDRLHEGTRFAQPAVYCSDLAFWARERNELDPQYMAGHSLGEIVALVAADCLSPEDGLRLVVQRARLSAESAANSGGGMLAVMVSMREAQALAEKFGVVIAAENSPEQFVLAGDRRRLERAASGLQKQAIACTILNVAGAFHSTAMKEAADAFRDILLDIDFRRPSIPVMSCVTAAPFILEELPHRLAESLTSTVRWREVLMGLHSRGVKRFVEVGPGKAMTGLVNRTLSDVKAISTDSPRAAAYA